MLEKQYMSMPILRSYPAGTQNFKQDSGRSIQPRWKESSFKSSVMSDFPLSDQILDHLGSDLWSEQISDLLISDSQPCRADLRSDEVTQVGLVDLYCRPGPCPVLLIIAMKYSTIDLSDVYGLEMYFPTDKPKARRSIGLHQSLMHFNAAQNQD